MYNNELKKYLEITKQFKSPFSMERAQKLIESKSGVQLSKKSNIVVKMAMAMLSMTAVICTYLFLGVPMPNNAVKENNIVKKANIVTSVKSESPLTVQMESKSIDKPSKLIDSNNVYEVQIQVDKEDVPILKLEGMNSITLTDEELIEFGISFSQFVNDNKIPTIEYSILIDSNTIEQNSLNPDYSNHSIGNIDSIKPKKAIKFQPVFITNFNGETRLYTSGYKQQKKKAANSQLLSDYNPLEKFDNRVMVNNLIAIKVAFKNDISGNGLIFWFEPTQKFIDALPDRYRAALCNEFLLLEKNEIVCGAIPNDEKTYLDIWKSCHGAIENLRVFPNPVQTQLQIEFQLKERRSVTFCIFDLAGNKCTELSKNISLGNGTQTFSFDVDKLNKGLYFFTVASEVGENAVQRFVKE